MAKRNFRVYDIAGKAHHFSAYGNAAKFAQKQVNASWSNGSWTVKDTNTDRSYQIARTNTWLSAEGAEF